jgi:hypothetical protein
MNCLNSRQLTEQIAFNFFNFILILFAVQIKNFHATYFPDEKYHVLKSRLLTIMWMYCGLVTFKLMPSTFIEMRI